MIIELVQYHQCYNSYHGHASLQIRRFSDLSSDLITFTWSNKPFLMSCKHIVCLVQYKMNVASYFTLYMFRKWKSTATTASRSHNFYSTLYDKKIQIPVSTNFRTKCLISIDLLITEHSNDTSQHKVWIYKFLQKWENLTEFVYLTIALIYIIIV